MSAVLRFTLIVLLMAYTGLEWCQQCWAICWWCESKLSQLYYVPVTARKDDIVKSDVWFHYKEGFSNAVRRSVKIQDLLNCGGIWIRGSWLSDTTTVSWDFGLWMWNLTPFSLVDRYASFRLKIIFLILNMEAVCSRELLYLCTKLNGVIPEDRSALWYAAWSVATKACAEILTSRMDMGPTAFTASPYSLPQAILQFRWQQQALLAERETGGCKTLHRSGQTQASRHLPSMRLLFLPPV
jgi:hypothetical protein